MRSSALVLVLGLIPFVANAVDSYPEVPAMPSDSDWVFVHQTESGLKTYIAKTSLKVLPDRSGFAVWLKLARSEDAFMAPMAAYMLHDCENPRRMRLGRAVNLLSHARSAVGRSAWLPDVPISTAIKLNFCPKIARLKAQEERDRTAGIGRIERPIQTTARALAAR
jgi:hypothetical protein